MITDTHTHLYSEQFDEDRDRNGETCLGCWGWSFFYSCDRQQLYPKNARLGTAISPKKSFLMMGLHPTSVKENYREELALVHEWIEKRDFVGIGEIGIDLYWDQSFLVQQKEAFRTQIQWAKQKKLPIVIHCREAFSEIFEVLESEKGADLFGIFHCFSGTLEQAKKAISYNMKLGIGGVATFKNGKIDTFLNDIDLKHLVLETDAPYLAPVPYRGKRNESSYITAVIDKLVNIYGVSFQEIAAITTQNSKDVFGI